MKLQTALAAGLLQRATVIFFKLFSQFKTSRTIALKVYSNEICMKIFSHPVTVPGCKQTFHYVQVRNSHTTLKAAGCPKGDAHVPLGLTIRKMAKAREECQLSGLFLGIARTECTWVKHMGAVGGSHICTDTQWCQGWAAQGEGRCAFVSATSEIQQVLNFPLQLRGRCCVVTPPPGVMWE